MTRKKRIITYRGWVRRLKGGRKIKRIFRILNSQPIKANLSHINWAKVNKTLEDIQKKYIEKEKYFAPSYATLHEPFTI